MMNHWGRGIRCRERYGPPGLRTGFTMIELLVTVAVVAILIALLIPALQSVRAVARSTQCRNNLRQVGIALHHHTANHGRPPRAGDFVDHLLPLAESQAATFVCPELIHLLAALPDHETALSYGCNACVHRMQQDSPRIVMTDASETVLHYEGQSSEEWQEVVRDRHGGLANVLLFDGSVQAHVLAEIDPYDSTNDHWLRKTLWKPLLPCDDGNFANGPCGLIGRYVSYGGQRAERRDATLSLPFGGLGGGVMSPVGSSVQQVVWTGQIRAARSGTYHFRVRVDNEASLYVGGRLVLSHVAGDAATLAFSPPGQPVDLSATRWTSIELRWREYHPGTPSHVTVEWRPEGGSWEAIPCDRLRTPP